MYPAVMSSVQNLTKVIRRHLKYSAGLNFHYPIPIILAVFSGVWVDFGPARTSSTFLSSQALWAPVWFF